MSLQAFIYSDDTLTASAASGKVVNCLVVFANSQADADAIIAQQIATSQLTNYPKVGGTVTKHRMLNSSFNKLTVLQKEDAGLSKGAGMEAAYPRVMCEWQMVIT